MKCVKFFARVGTYGPGLSHCLPGHTRFTVCVCVCVSPDAWISGALHPQGTISKIIIRPWRRCKRCVCVCICVCERKGQAAKKKEEAMQTPVMDINIMSKAFL